jgi:hypothetical protein
LTHPRPRAIVGTRSARAHDGAIDIEREPRHVQSGECIEHLLVEQDQGPQRLLREAPQEVYLVAVKKSGGLLPKINPKFARNSCVFSAPVSRAFLPPTLR